VVGTLHLPGDKPILDRVARDVQPDEHHGDDEREYESAGGDPGPDGPAIHAVPLLHRGAELVPGEGRGHVGETIPVTSDLRLMAVHAHPDDESSKGAATTAKYRHEGVDIMVVTCTGGERGDVLNAAAQAEVDLHGLHAVRMAEMAAAVQALGVRHAWLGFEDSGFPEGDPPPPLPTGCFADLPVEETVPPLVALIRSFRPQVVTTYDEKGGYPHPDHIRTHETTMAAVEAAADASYRPDLGEPWQVLKVYYNHQFTRARVIALHEAMLDVGLESPYQEWLDGWRDESDMFTRVTTRVDASDFFDVRDAALLAHRTQIDPEGMWFAVPLEMQKRVWPTEDFELAVSHVDTTLPEDDLFAGIRARREDAS